MGQAYLYRALLLVCAAWFLIMLFLFAPGLFRRSDVDQKILARSKRIDELLRHKQKMFFPNGTLKNPLMLNKTTLHVCYSADAGTILGLVASMGSVARNTRHPVHFHVLVEKDIEKDLTRWLPKLDLRSSKVDVHVFNTDLLHNYSKEKDENLMTYARFFYADLFPKLHGKVLHLDTDTIVQADVAELMSVPLGKHIIAVSEDCQGTSKHYTSYKPQYLSYLNFNNDVIKSRNMSALRCTFNAGVYVLNIDRWRKNNVTQTLLLWMKLNKNHDLWGNEKGGGGALPPMLIVFYKSYTVFDPMWHVRHLGWRVRQTYSLNFIKSAKLLHWSGRFKPWTGRSQLSEIWDSYYIPDPQEKYRPVRRQES